MQKTSIVSALLLALLALSACESAPALSPVEVYPLSSDWKADPQMPHTYRAEVAEVAWLALGYDPGRPDLGIRLHVRPRAAGQTLVSIVPGPETDVGAGSIGDYQRLLGHHLEPDGTARHLEPEQQIPVDTGFYVNIRLRNEAFIRPYPPREGSGFRFDLVLETGGKRHVVPVQFYLVARGADRISPWIE